MQIIFANYFIQVKKGNEFLVLIETEICCTYSFQNVQSQFEAINSKLRHNIDEYIFALISQNNRDVTFVKFLSPMRVDVSLQPQFSQTCIRSLFHTTLVQNGGIYHFKSPICGGGGGSQSSNHVYLLYYQSRRGKEIRIDLNFHF